MRRRNGSDGISPVLSCYGLNRATQPADAQLLTLIRMRLLHRIVLGTIAAAFAAACTSDPQAAKQKYVASGDSYLAAGKLQEAIIEYRNAIEQDPRAGDVRAKLADAYVQAGDGSSAVQEYVRAADLVPDDTTIALKAGGLFLLGNQFDDAKLWAEKVLAKKPRDLQAQILLASSLAGLKDLDAAVKEIEEAIRLDPERGATYTNLGAFELRRGQIEAAERAFKKAVELDPKSGLAQLALANFYWSAARWPEAEAALKTALVLEPENPFAHRVLATFYQATNRAADAEPHLKKVFELTKAPEAALALADYYLGRKNYVAARGLLDQMASTPGTALVAEIRLAALAHDLDQSQDAYDRLERVLEKDETNLQALVAKSTFLLADRKPDEALAAATLGVEKHPDSAAAFFTLGRVQAARFQTQAAIAAYQSALRLNPRATDSKIAIARLQLAAGGNDASVSLAQEALTSEPENPDARLVLIGGCWPEATCSAQRPSSRFSRVVSPTWPLFMCRWEGSSATAGTRPVLANSSSARWSCSRIRRRRSAVCWRSTSRQSDSPKPERG